MKPTTGWVIVREGMAWPWSGAFVFRTRAGAVARWTEDYWPWKKCYRAGDRAVRVTVRAAQQAQEKGR